MSDVEKTVEELEAERVAAEEADKDKTFDYSYVEKLRRENAAKRKEADEAKAALEAEREAFRQERTTAAVTRIAGEILADPADLLLHNPEADIYAEDGTPDIEKIRTAAHALREAKPYLASRTFGGDIGMGNRGKEQSNVRSMDDMLRMFR
jgi:hypothetical protein